MTFADTFSPMADHLRAEYGITDKLTTNQLKLGINGLHVHNYLTDDQVIDQTIVPTGGNKVLNEQIKASDWEKLLGKTVNLSMDITWSNYHYDASLNNRIGYEFGIYYEQQNAEWVNCWLLPHEESGTKHISNTFKLQDKASIKYIEEGSFFNQVNQECTFKATNLKIVENPMGGVIKPNLLDLNKVELEGFTTQQSSLFVFNATFIYDYGYSEFLSFEHFQPKKNTKYRLSFTARGHGNVKTYVYGNNLNGTYVDNGTTWNLTDNWRDFTQDFPVESVPLDANFNFRTTEIVSGEITNLKFIEL